MRAVSGMVWLWVVGKATQPHAHLALAAQRPRGAGLVLAGVSRPAHELTAPNDYDRRERHPVDQRPEAAPGDPLAARRVGAPFLVGSDDVATDVEP